MVVLSAVSDGRALRGGILGGYVRVGAGLKWVMVDAGAVGVEVESLAALTRSMSIDENFGIGPRERGGKKVAANF